MQSITLKKDKFSQYADGSLGCIQGSAEASDLGLQPGIWPDKLETPFGEMILQSIDTHGNRKYVVPFTQVYFTIWND